MLIAARPHEGVADPAQHLRRKAFSVVDDAQQDAIGGVLRIDPDRTAGEIHRILHQIAQAVDQFGAAQHHGRRACACDGEHHLNAARHMRFSGLLQHDFQRGLSQQQIILSGLAHRTQDIAAAVGLFVDQPGVFGQIRLILQLIHHLRADQLDGGQGRSQLMRGSGDDTAKVGQLLFPRQGHLRRQKRVRHRVHLGRHPTRIQTKKGDADQQRQPEPKAEQSGDGEYRAIGQS